MRIGYHRVLATASGAPLLDGSSGALLSGQVLGGAGWEWITDVVVDTSGAVYLGGQTSSPDFVTGALMTGASGTTTTDGFVVKLTFPALTLTPSTRRIAYGYDELNRLTSATESGASTASYAYAYDRAGNRTGVTTNGVAVAYTYSITDTVLNPGWNYDAVGNLLSDGTRTYTYDALSRMTSQLVGGGRTDYTYNGDGVLVGDTRGVVVNQYAQDLAAPLPQVLQINQDSTYYGLDRLATDLVPSSRQWYLHDALGSTRQTVQGGGSLNAGRYDPWGAPIDNQIAPFGFAGELQGEGGLVYLRARWYTPQQGVFTSRDPFAGFPEQPYSQHYFQYGYSNPVLVTDPSGRCVGAGCAKVGQNQTDAMTECFARGGLWDPFLKECRGGWPFPPPNNPNPEESASDPETGEVNIPNYLPIAGGVARPRPRPGPGTGLIGTTLLATLLVCLFLAQDATIADTVPQPRSRPDPMIAFYHGTDVDSARNIMQNGILPGYTVNKALGDGFYTFKYEDAGDQWALTHRPPAVVRLTMKESTFKDLRKRRLVREGPWVAFPGAPPEPGFDQVLFKPAAFMTLNTQASREWKRVENGYWTAYSGVP